MNASEEIIISGGNFIERRIILFPEQVDTEDLQARGFGRGYEYGWARGLAKGLAIVGVVALCIWLAVISCAGTSTDSHRRREIESEPVSAA
jgi:hypothetical protein